MKTIYISGRISGLQFNKVERNFNCAEEQLKKKGYKVVSSIKDDIDPSFSWEKRLAFGIVQMQKCDAIYLLKNWDNSKGSIIQKNVAELLGKEIIYEEPQHNILNAIVAVMGVSEEDIKSSNRSMKYVYARMIFARLCRDNGKSISYIASVTNRNIASVSQYIKRYDDEYKYSLSFRNSVEEVENYIEETNK